MLKLKKIGLIKIILLLLLALPAGATEPPFRVQAESAILMEYSTGQILFAQNIDAERVPASLVKIMTLFVAYDALAAGIVQPSETFVVSRRAWEMQGSRMFIEQGERVSLEQLIKGIAVVSGNDASVAIAEAVSGSEDVFVNAMNRKARELGLNQTFFIDVHGLSSAQTTSALDMAKLARAYIAAHPQALEIHSMRSFAYQPRSSTTPIEQNNRNTLLWNYPGTDGLKTGFLTAAGYNLVATAQRDGTRLIAVVLGGESERGRAEEVTRLLNYGFRNFHTVQARDVASLPQPVPVYKGAERRLNVTIDPASQVVLSRGTEARVRTEVTVNEPLVAPIEEGDVVGRVRLILDGATIQEADLLAAEDLPQGGFFRRLWDSIRLMIQNLINRD